MNWEKFNNRLRKDAEGQNNDVDIDSIWGAIEPQVDEINTTKKKKRRAIFFWWGAGVLLLSVGLWFLGNQFSQKESIAQNTDNQTITSKPVTPKKDLSADLNAKNKSTKENGFGENNLANASASLEDNVPKSNYSNNENQSKASPSKSKPSQSSKSNVVLNNKRTIDNISAIVPIVSMDEGIIIRGSQSSNDESRIKEEILNISSLINWLDFSSEKISLENEKKVWYPIPKKKSLFSIGINVGVNYTHRTLTTQSEDANTLLQNREAYETPLETSQIGVNFSYKILNKEKFNLEIITGLQLTSIAERYKYYNTTTEIISENWGVEYLSYGLGSEPIEIMGWINQSKTTEYKKEIFNTYRMIDIPVLISYNRSFGKKWQVGIQGGIFANLSLKTEGIIPYFNLADFDLASDELNIFKSNVGLSYHLGLNFKRTLSERWELSFSPAVRYFGNNFATDNYWLSQKYVLLGGNVGVNYRF